MILNGSNLGNLVGLVVSEKNLVAYPKNFIYQIGEKFGAAVLFHLFNVRKVLIFLIAQVHFENL